MKIRVLYLFMGLLLMTSGVARADSITIDGLAGPFLDTDFELALPFDRLAPGSFYYNGYGVNGQLLFSLTAVFDGNKLIITDQFHDGSYGFESAFFALPPAPPEFKSIALLSSNFSPSLIYGVDGFGDIIVQWPGTNVPDQTMTATFLFTTAANPVPEPSSIVLLGTGCAYGLSLLRRRQVNHNSREPLFRF